MLDGRVKTLHPKIFGGILAMRENNEHMEQVGEHEIKMIDMVVCNLYPFEETINKKDVTFDDAIENIDIGGPSLLRAAAKNFSDVIVVTDPEDYDKIISNLEKGEVDQEIRKNLARKVYEKTSVYDNLISNYLNSQLKEKELFSENMVMSFSKIQELRYGENPHQKAAFYKDKKIMEASLANEEKLHGKELSYNNIMDTDGAIEIIKEFKEPACAVIKHANPCGAAIAGKIELALEKAYNADPLSAFGCIIALNRNCNLKCAEFMKGKFVEVVVAPGFDDDALKLLEEKKNIRILKLPGLLDHQKTKSRELFTIKKVVGGLLVQTRGYPDFDELELKVVTKRKPTEKEIKDMIFAAKVCKHVKSNSVLYAKDNATVGIGAGQMSRVDATIIATRKSEGRAKGASMASDAFFPFRDGVDEAAKAGISAIIQPGGSIRDKEVIEAANEHNIAMVFSGVRLFLH